MTDPKTKKHVLGLVLGYLATLGGGGGAAWWLYGELQIAKDEKAGIEKDIALAEVKIKRIPDLEGEVIILRENVSELVKILPNSREVNQFVDKLSAFGVESGVTINSLHDEKDRSKGKGTDAFDKVIYKVELTANVTQFMAFMSLCESWERFVRVSSFEVKGGDWDDEMSRDEVRHDIRVNLETFSYRGNEDQKPLAIVNYDKKREQLMDEIIIQRGEIKVERYDYVANPLRRDPFVDPRRRLADEKDGGLPYAEQKALVELLTTAAGELADLVAASKAGAGNFIRRLELANEIDTKFAQLKAQYDGAIAANSVTDTQLRRRIDRDVVPVMKELLQQAQTPDMTASLPELQRFSADMLGLLENGQFQAVLEKHKVINGRIEASRLTSECAVVLADIERLATQAEVAIEFEKKELKITGAVVQASGSVVVINGQVLREGDMLEDGLVVHRIAADRIEFEFKGVVLARAR